MCCLLRCFLFFKQKTAYEMRISDWSSDVCSSDLGLAEVRRGLDLSERTPGFLSTMAYAYAVAGQPEPAREILEGLEQQAQERYVSPYSLAVIQIGSAS